MPPTASRIDSIQLRSLLLMPALFAAAAQGEVDEGTRNDGFRLGEVVVTARTLDDVMIGGAEVDQDTLRSFGKNSVDQALDLIPGAVASNTGGSRNERLVYIRGFDRFQTTLSIDGVRVFLPADNRIDFARFLTADLSKIQISKGYVSVLDGPGGMGGAINLVTRKPNDSLEAEAMTNASFAAEDYNGYTLSGLVGTRQPGFYLQATGTKSQQDFWRLSDDFTPTSLEDGGKRNNSDSDDYRINLKAGYTPNATDEYALNYTRQSGEKNAPYHVTDTANTRYWAWPYWDLDSLYFLSSTQLGAKTYLRGRVYVNSFENALYAYDNAAQTMQSLPRAFRSFYKDSAQGATVELGSSPTDTNTLRAALHYRRDKHKEFQDAFVRVPAAGSPFSNVPYTEPEQTTEEDTYSIALEDTQRFGSRMDLVSGLSYDWTDLRRAEDFNLALSGSTLIRLPLNYPLRNAHALNGQAALNMRVTDVTQLHLSASSRVRFPTLMERFSARFGTAVPNPDIGPERALNVELGADANLGKTRLAGAVFYSKLSDALFSVSVPFGAPFNAVLTQTRNVGEGRYRGIELSIDTALASSLQLGGNYTYLQRKLTDPTNPAFRPTGVPLHKAFAHLDWRINKQITITPNVEWNSNRWTVTSSTAINPPRYYRTGSFTLFNLTGSWTVNEHFDVLLGLRNAFDRNYQLVDGFPESGRTEYVSVRARY